MSRHKTDPTPTAVVGSMGLPPSHAQEHHTSHRAFLIRSLERCDTDLAALVELNRSLRKIKASIIGTCGEATLLDLGEGLVTLTPQGTSLQGKNVPSEGQGLCVDFLLRMKLRHKLLNRLARRLNRLAHAMDGEDVQPPAPPKYGDLRLQIDPQDLEKFAELQKRREKARLAIELAHQTQLDSPEKTYESEQQEKGTEEDDQQAKEEENKETQEKKEDEGKATESHPVETKDEEAKDEPKVVDNETAEAKDDPKLSVCQPDGASSNEEPDKVSSVNTTLESQSKAAAIDYDALREYDEAYTKEIMPSTRVVAYPLLEQEGEEDFNSIKYGAGIGASHKTMSSKEKEIEFKRWQTSILARIPDQPTFEELGMDKRVFFLEERRKRLAEEQSLLGTSKKKKPGTKKNDDIDSDEDEEMAEADDEDEDFEVEKSEQSDDDEDKDQTDDANEAADDKKKKAEPALIKLVKPISLVAVPSFHEQDIKRMRIIHSDLMVMSIHEHARLRVQEATLEYNESFRRSNSIYSHRMQIQTQLNSLNYDHRVKTSKLRNDYNLEVAVARSRWQKEKALYDANRAKKAMPSAFGKPTMGTQLTGKFSNRPDPVSFEVGKTVADIVDAVVLRDESGWTGVDKFRDFVPPRPPPALDDPIVDENTGETLSQRQELSESNLRKALADVEMRLRMSEEERTKAWKKLLKIKGEFDNNNPAWRRGKMDPNSFPLPPLRATTVMPQPQRSYAPPMSYRPPLPVPPPPQVPVPAVLLPPPVPPAAGQNISESKYSAARVRERIAPDGSVMPVTEPKKSKDGLYQRPAGRTRKGMDWDPVRGIWIPDPEESAG